MVPGVPVLERPELIGERVAQGNRALRDPIHTIHLHGVQLTDAMPVDGCPVSIVVVLDVNLQLIAPTRLDQGPGKRLVEDLSAGLRESVGSKLVKASALRSQRHSEGLCRLTVTSPSTSSQYYLPVSANNATHGTVEFAHLPSDTLRGSLNIFIYPSGQSRCPDPI